MSHQILVDEQYSFLYDPYLYGYADGDFWKAFKGTPEYISGKIRFRSATASTLGTYMFGNFNFKFTIPAAPTTGDSRIWGFYSRSNPNRNAAYFFIQGSSFYTRTYGDDTATAEQNTIAWDSEWTNTPTEFEIRWRISTVEFWIGNGTDKVRVANHNAPATVPKQKLVPIYVSNGGSDLMDLSYLEVTNVRKFAIGNINWYSSTSTTSSSTSSSSSSTSSSTTSSTSSSTSSSSSSTSSSTSLI